MAYTAHMHVDKEIPHPSCGHMTSGLMVIKLTSCFLENPYSGFICELPRKQTHLPRNDSGRVPSVRIRRPTSDPFHALKNRTVLCPSRHVTHTFLACDLDSACWAHGLGSAYVCKSALRPLPPSFVCTNGFRRVPFTLVCDHRQDCDDGSDEDFCEFPECDAVKELECGNHQCIPRNAWCDGMRHCTDGDDESQCYAIFSPYKSKPTFPPARILLHGNGTFTFGEVKSGFQNDSELCPETDFQCSGNGYCLPVFVRCNGVYDCTGREDEAECDSYVCEGFYRCRNSKVCLHPQHVCDEVFQCPENDDEVFCHLTCPHECQCYGLAFYCGSPFKVSSYVKARFLDLSGSGMGLGDIENNTLLVYLRLSFCQISEMQVLTLPNLNILDLSFNSIHTADWQSIRYLKNLRDLSLAGNPVTVFFVANVPAMRKLLTLDLSDLTLKVRRFHVRDVSIFPQLQKMNLSNSGIEHVMDDGFQPLRQLRILDLRECPVTSFARGVFQGLEDLQLVYADNYKLCCPATLPKTFAQQNCRAPSDEVSSCNSLLRSNIYRVSLSLFAAFSLIGNSVSFFYRAIFHRESQRQAFGVFVTHLSVADFSMGVYLATIGVADRLYQGNYLWKDVSWKYSVACQMAGFLSFQANEMSALVICLITLDRFLVLRFPFSRFRFRCWSAHMACAVAWSVSLALAAVPLLPFTSHWYFYSQSGICIPLPITRRDFGGHRYSFTILIIVNFVLFLMIAVGQVSIYLSIRSNRLTITDSSQKSKDMTIARRLITVAMSDFLCWFPIGLLGLMASSGTPIPGEVNVAMAILVLPLNAALNPFLYTLNMILERSRRHKEERLRKLLTAELRAKATSNPPGPVERTGKQ